MVDKTPEVSWFLEYSFPKGQRAIKASLNVCIPNGIPTTVKQSKILARKYSRAIKTPPNNSQIKFPNNFIYVYLQVYEASIFCRPITSIPFFNSFLIGAARPDIQIFISLSASNEPAVSTEN